MAEDDDEVMAGLIFFGEKVAPQGRLHAERRQEAVADAHAHQAFRLAAVNQVERSRANRHHALEDRVLFLPVEKIARRTGKLGELRQFRLTDHQQPVGFGERQRPKQDRVDDREDGGVGADAERQCNDGYSREARRFQQHARPVADVL